MDSDDQEIVFDELIDATPLIIEEHEIETEDYDELIILDLRRPEAIDVGYA